MTVNGRPKTHITRRKLLGGLFVAAGASLLAACNSQPQTVEVTRVVEKQVPVTQVVEKQVTQVVEKQVPVTQVVEKQVTQIVTQVVDKPVPVTVTPFTGQKTTIQVASPYGKTFHDALSEGLRIGLPNIDVQFNGAIVEPEQYFTQLAAGSPPDLYRPTTGNLTFMVAKGAFSAYDPYLMQDKVDASDMFPGFAAYCQVQNQKEGKWFLWPFIGSTWAMFYNGDMIQAAGFSDPWELDKQGKWDIETATQIGQKLTNDKQGKDKVYGLFALTFPEAAYYSSNVYAYGGGFYSDDGTKVLIAEPASIQAHHWLQDLFQKYKIHPDSPTFAFDPADGAFKTQHLAVYGENQSNRRSSVGQVKDFKWGAVPYPKGPGGQGVVSAAYGWCMTKSGTHKDQAWQVAKWLAERGHILALKEFGSLPLYQSLLTSKDWTDSLVAGMESPDIWKRHIELGKIVPQVPGNKDLDTILTNEVYPQIMQKGANVESTLKTIGAKMQQTLDAAWKDLSG